ncbi:MAG: bifunctional chorismate mutase/prephenate dehydrogenase [Planctomycetes bacterium]|nr:bifunctional chorismate mutase/prephenate dehydrogenase [Planctomycetota bacterium]
MQVALFFEEVMDISALREEVDRIDAAMLKLLDQRIALARQISEAKRSAGMPLRDAEREHTMLNAARGAELENLRPEEAADFRSALLQLTRTSVSRHRRPPEPMKIAIIGIGLIGGSLARALKTCQPEHQIVGVDLDARLPAAGQSGLFDSLESPTNGDKAVKRADVVFLCTPLARTIELLPTLAQDVPKDAIVTDVVGVKQAVVQAAQEAFNFPDAPYFVGGHPMAGKARNGFEHSDARLFEDRAWVLTPDPHDPVDKLNRLGSLIESVGATVRLMSPGEHDRAMAAVSHLPQLISTALMLTAGRRDKGVAGPALLEMTRLAASPAHLWNDLTVALKPELIADLQRLKSYLTELEMAVNFQEPLDKWFGQANELRALLEDREVARQQGSA